MSINTSYAKGLVSNYANSQWAIIDATFEQQYHIKDARSVWFSLDALKAFIHEIEQQNPQGIVTTGVRFYYGAYSQVTPSPISPDYNNLHTLFAISTYTGADGKNYDYDAATGSSDFANLQTVTGMNHGNLVPPPDTSAMYAQGDLFMAYADNVAITATEAQTVR